MKDQDKIRKELELLEKIEAAAQVGEALVFVEDPNRPGVFSSGVNNKAVPKEGTQQDINRRLDSSLVTAKRIFIKPAPGCEPIGL